MKHRNLNSSFSRSHFSQMTMSKRNSTSTRTSSSSNAFNNSPPQTSSTTRASGKRSTTTSETRVIPCLSRHRSTLSEIASTTTSQSTMNWTAKRPPNSASMSAASWRRTFPTWITHFMTSKYSHDNLE